MQKGMILSDETKEVENGDEDTFLPFICFSESNGLECPPLEGEKYLTWEELKTDEDFIDFFPLWENFKTL